MARGLDASTFGPLLSVLIASGIAGSHSCALNEGSVHPCRVGGLGELLSSVGVLGWRTLVILPTGLIAGGVGLAVWLVRRRPA